MVSGELSYYLLPCEKDTNLVDKYFVSHIYGFNGIMLNAFFIIKKETTFKNITILVNVFHNFNLF